ncbi:MAG: putative lipid II flippase FtsW [Candidatus Kerfeldbacteria bacterium]|nr:putative lipid II flippase FtsW [Candidatus Kerfeldbacteria bacterium]
MSVSTHKPDYRIIAIVGVIVLYGLVMLASASSVLSFEKFGDSNYLLKHQLLYGVLIGTVGLIVMAKIDYHVWRKFAFPLMAVTVILLLGVLIPGIGFEYGGARRWIQLGPIIFQPSEMLKLAFILYLATLFEKNKEGIKEAGYGLIPFIIIAGSVVFLIMLQPDMGTMVTIALIGFLIFYVAGAPLKHLAILVASAVSLFFVLIKLAPYRAARFTVFLNPALDPQGIGYHINQALLAIGSGGLFGLGLGHSRQKYLYLPEVTGDSIFAIVAEEMGLFMSVALILLFIWFMKRGLLIAKKAPDTFGKLVATGIVIWIVMQAFINIAAMVTLVPLTGIPLPFISYGSSALVTSLVAIGILINISKQTKA